MGRARHRRDRRRWPSGPGPGSVRTPTWSSCPARRTCSTTALVAALRTAIDATARDRERDRERAGRAGDLAAHPGVVPALVAGRAARALRAGPAGGHGGDLVPGPARERPGPRRGGGTLPGRPEAAAGRPGRRRRVAAVAARPGAAAPEPRSSCGPPRVRRLAAITVVLHVVVDRLLPGLRRGGRAGAAAGAADRRGRACSPRTRWRTTSAGATKSRPPRGSSRSRRGWWRSPGSYGKTSTKNYAAHLMAGRWSVLASPASFNNVLGLARAVNDRLTPGHRRVRRRDGHLRAGRDRPAVPAVPARGLRDHHDRRGAPGADEGPRHDRARQVRDPRAGQHDRAERRRARAGRGRRIGTQPRSG